MSCNLALVSSIFLATLTSPFLTFQSQERSNPKLYSVSLKPEPILPPTCTKFILTWEIKKVFQQALQSGQNPGEFCALLTPQFSSGLTLLGLGNTLL